MPFTPIAGKYSPHIDLSMHPATGVVSITVAFHINRGANCRLYELAPPYSGQPVLKRDWIQGQNDVLGPFGHGASLALPNGALLVAVPAGLDSAENVTPTILIEPGYSPPFALGGQGGVGPAGPKGDKGDPGVAGKDGLQGVQGVPGIPGTGGSTVEPRVDALVSQVGALGQQLAHIETALGNIGTGEGLSEADQEALRRLKAWLGIT